jgi:hypothetical protein
MYKAIEQYLRSETFPRWRGIVFATETVIAVAVAVVISSRGPEALGGGPRVADLVTGPIAYSSIALGFCVAGMALTLTLPDRQFACTLAKTTIATQPKSAYSNLIFVFSWTATVHWVALVTLFAVIIVTDSSSSVFSSSPSCFRRALVGSLAGIYLYCLLQFFITLITLSQVGNLYIGSLVKPKQDPPAR